MSIRRPALFLLAAILLTAPLLFAQNPFGEEAPFRPDRDRTDTIILDVVHSEHKGIQLRTITEGSYRTTGWFGQDRWLAWSVPVSEPGSYFVELSWASVQATGKVAVAINGDKALEWDIRPTKSRDFFRAEIIGRIDLPEGNPTLSLHLSGTSEGATLDVREVRLIPAAVQKERQQELKRQPRLGMTVSELDALWGQGRECRSMPIGDQIKIGVRDVTELCTYRIWTKDDLKLAAAFIDGKAALIRVDVFDKRPALARELAAIMLPGFQIPPLQPEAVLPVSLAASGPGRPYLFVCHTGYFDISNPEEFKKTSYKGNVNPQGVHAQAIKRIADLQQKNAVFKRRQELLKQCRIGMTLGAWRLLLGASDRPDGSNAYDRRAANRKWSMGSFDITGMFYNDYCYAFELSSEKRFTVEELSELVAILMPGMELSVTLLPPPRERSIPKITSKDDPHRHFFVTWKPGESNIMSFNVHDQKLRNELSERK